MCLRILLISSLKLVFILLLHTYRTNGQNSLGCPFGWELNVDRCYKFESDKRLIFEDADSACLANGSSLLSINTFQEHKFISDWLMKHDLYDPFPWFTSGFYQSPYVVWDGETLADTTAPTYWIEHPSTVIDQAYIQIAYVRGYAGFDGYGWRVVSASTPSNYICEIARNEVLETQILQRNFSYGLGNIDIKNIPKAPHIIMEPDTLLVLDTVPNIHIECIADGNPTPSYKWLKDGKEITSSTDNRYTLSAGRCSIQNPKSTIDQGIYQCQAINEFGITLSSPAKIVFGYLQSFSPVKPENVRANKFEGTRMSCNAPASFPDKAYTWFMYDTGQPIFENHNNMFMSSTGYLYFSEVQPTDQREYFCVVTLSTSSEYTQSIGIPPSRTGLKFWLIVTGTEHGYFKPFIYTNVVPTPAIRGSRIRIECIAYGSLPVHYTWHREGGRPFEPGTSKSDLDRVLTIENAQLSAEGNYVCTANGRGGITSEVVTLTVEAKPYFPYNIGDRFVDPGQTVKWRCKAVARPEATYTWYKNGVIITNSPGHIEIRRNYLLIINVQAEDDEGMYHCAATNLHGTTFSSGQLKVLSFSPTFDRRPLPPVTHIPLGGSYSIACPVEAAPRPEVLWLKNGATLALVPGETTGHLGMTIFNDLIFNNIDNSDQGFYTCKASNINGVASNSTQVEVLRGIAIFMAPKNTEVEVNRTAFLFCQASYDSFNYDLTYVWTHNGHIIDLKKSTHFVQSQLDGLDGLYIRNVQFEHSGAYTCEARTTMHVAVVSAILTVMGPPGAPAGVHVRTPLINNTAMVIWTVTAEINHGNPISRYIIEAELGLYPGKWDVIASDILEHNTISSAISLGLRNDQRMAVVEGLLPNNHYSFRVRAINDFGSGDEAGRTTEQVKTDSKAPITVPKNIRGKDTAKVGTLHILWDPLDPSEYAGDGVGYYVYFKKEDDPKEWFKVTVEGVQNSYYAHLVGEEFFYLPFSVMVAAFNQHGHGPNSSVHQVMSAEGMPIATVIMQDSDNYNESSFTMAWIPIEDTREAVRGRLKGYRLRYWNKLTPDFITWRDVYGQAENAIIIGLEHNANFWGSVQVMNFAGVGPIGELRWGETWHMAPNDYPRHVKVFSHSSSSVLVKWQGITTTSTFDLETLEGYIVRVWKVQEDIRSAVDTKVEKEEEAIVENLQTHTAYVLRVLGYSRGGDGTLGPHVYFTVEGGALAFDPTTTEICYSHLECDSATYLQISMWSFLLTYIMHIHVL